MHYTSWYISLPSLHDLDVKFPDGTFYGGRKHIRRRIFLSLSKLGCGLQEFNSRKFHLHLIFKASWNNRDDEFILIVTNFAAAAIVVAQAPNNIAFRLNELLPPLIAYIAEFDFKASAKLKSPQAIVSNFMGLKASKRWRA